MFRQGFAAALMASIALAPVAVRAQSAALGDPTYTTTVPVTWTGTVTTGSDGTVQLRDAGGTIVPYAGALPATIYKAGDAVTISFSAAMPNQAYFDSSPFNPVRSADGIYRVTLATQGSAGCCNGVGIGTATAPVLTIGGKVVPGVVPEGVVMTLVYNYNTNTYGIDGSKLFSTGPFVGDGYKYDVASGQLVPCSGIACDPTFNPADGPKNSFNVLGNAGGTQMTIPNANIIASGGSANGGVWGSFGAVFSGSWNLQEYSGATAVPEPGMLGMFGAAALLLPLRRRRARKAG